MNIAQKTVLITGANRGIGRALLTEALRRGAKRVYAGARAGTLDITDPRVTTLTLDVTDPAQIERAAAQVDALDLLVNNAGVGLFDDLSNPDLVEQHLKVNLLGALRMTQAFLPRLERSKGAILNISSLAAVAAVPMMPSYSISKAAALNMTQALWALLASKGVTVHAAILGPIDTDMVREANLPKTPPALAAQGIFEGLDRGEEEIFPDPMSQPVAEGWRNSVSKILERQFTAFVPDVSTATGSAGY
jgi:NAD(P)-dependent dehydrogenase (short-subunit alcohol dehydrogenase family)